MVLSSFINVSMCYLLTTATGPFNEEIIDAHSFMQKDYINKLSADYGQWFELVEFENRLMHGNPRGA